MHKACLPCDEAEGARGLRGPAPGSWSSDPAAGRSCPRSAGLPQDDPALVTTCTWPRETPKKSLSRRQWWPLQIADQQQDIKVIDPKPGPQTPLCAGLSLSSMQPTARDSLGPAEVTLRTPFWGQHSPKIDSSEGEGEGDRTPSLPVPFPRNQRAELLGLRLQWPACWQSPGEEAGPAASLVRSLSPLGNPCLPPVASRVGAPRGDESHITQPGSRCSRGQNHRDSDSSQLAAPWRGCTQDQE